MLTPPPITLTHPDLARLQHLLSEAGDGEVRHLLLERLETELLRAAVVNEGDAGEAVGLGDRVVYENLTSGQRREVVLVAPEAARPGTEYLSVLTPVGCSLIGLRQGDTFEWDEGPHRWHLKVISVHKAH